MRWLLPLLIVSVVVYFSVVLVSGTEITTAERWWLAGMLAWFGIEDIQKALMGRIGS